MFRSVKFGTNEKVACATFLSSWPCVLRQLRCVYMATKQALFVANVCQIGISARNEGVFVAVE